MIFPKSISFWKNCMFSFPTYLLRTLPYDRLFTCRFVKISFENPYREFSKGLRLIILTMQGCVRNRPDSFKEKYDPKESEQIHSISNDRSKRFVQSLKRLCQRNIIHYHLISNFIDFLCLGLYIYRTYRIPSIPGIIP